MRYVVGVDLGGTNSKIGILNEEGILLRSTSIKTISEEGIEKTFSRIWNSIKELALELGIESEKIEGIGMGIPGPVEHQEIVGFFANFPWQTGINASQLMREISGIKLVKLDNDANVIALGEAKYGAGRGSESSVTIAIGTGIGGGIYVDGNLISGFKGAGGEVGHIKVERDGKLCGCGQKGCWEAYASATGLIRETVSRLVVNKNNLIYKMVEGDISKIEAKTVFDAAKEGDAFALDLVEYEADYIALGIGNVLNLINPEVIILGGGVALAGDILLKRVEEKLKEYALPITLKGLKIKQSELGNDAGVMGASA
ncbi:MAG: ROK family protein, partial [Fusobacteriaceae bacterium]